MGDCADWQGTIAGESVVIKQLPPTHNKKDPYYAVDSDIYKKMVAVSLRLLQSKRKSHVRLPGCPVSVAEQVLTLANLSGARNPYFDPRIAIDFSKSYLAFRMANLLRFRPYQKRKRCVESP
jgi:hypothetical protein